MPTNSPPVLHATHGSPLHLPLIDIATPPFVPEERTAATSDAVRLLAKSIREHGIIQPIIVRSVPPTWVAVAGSFNHRREWYAVDASAFVAQTYAGDLSRFSYQSEREATARAVAMNRPYQVICGARRLAAAKLAGLSTVPVVVVESTVNAEAMWKASNVTLDIPAASHATPTNTTAPQHLDTCPA